MASCRFSKIGPRAFLEFFERGAGEAEKRFVVAPQRIGGERLECVGKPRLGVALHLLFFRGRLALLFETGLQRGQFLSQSACLDLRHAGEGKLIGETRLQFCGAHVAGVEALLQRRGLGAQDEPGGDAGHHRREDEAEHDFHARC